MSFISYYNIEDFQHIKINENNDTNKYEQTIFTTIFKSDQTDLSCFHKFVLFPQIKQIHNNTCCLNNSMFPYNHGKTDLQNLKNYEPSRQQLLKNPELFFRFYRKCLNGVTYKDLIDLKASEHQMSEHVNDKFENIYYRICPDHSDCMIIEANTF